MGASTDPSHQALIPFCRQLHLQELCLSTRAILARLPASKMHPLAVVPSSRVQLTGLDGLADCSAPRRVKLLLPARPHSAH